MDREQMIIRRIRPCDDPAIAAIIRANLERAHLDIPGTAYFDPELDHLSQYYQISPGQRAYFILEDDKGQVAGGVGLAEFGGIEKCVELQKLEIVGYENPCHAIVEALAKKLEELLAGRRIFRPVNAGQIGS